MPVSSPASIELERCDLAVVAEDDELADETLLLGDIDRAERHRVIDAIDAAEIGMGGKDRVEHVLGLLAVPIGHLVGDDLDLRMVLLQSVDESVGALIADNDAWRSVEDRDLAFASHGLAHRLGDVHCAVVVVHLDVRGMRLGGVDVEGDDRNAGALGLGDRRRKRHRVDRLQEDDRGALADQRVHETGLHLDLVLTVEQFVVDDLLRL